MKNSKAKQPNPVEIENQSVDQFKQKLDLQNSAIQKLTKLLAKTTKTVGLLIFISSCFQAFSQSASLTWVSGPNTADSAGVYGTKGLDPLEILPGSRAHIATAKDANGHIWIFGGEGFDKNGNSGKLSDLWKWNGSTWIWLSGTDVINSSATYGTKGVAAASNSPGGRDNAACWVDGNGTFWLHGGRNSNTEFYSDLWKWDGTNWTWVSGLSSFNSAGSFGTKNVTSSSSFPGSRYYASYWIDNNDNLWLFGGRRYTSTSHRLNDLWKWDGTNWTWMSGSSSSNSSGNFGTKGLTSSSNVPSARYGGATWKDASGNFWLFGGWGYDSNSATGNLNDMWKWDGANWTWVSGSSLRNQLGVYGTKGVASSTSQPGGRSRPAISQLNNGNVLLYGGYGYASSNSIGYLKDLWQWDGTNWTWLSGVTSTNTNNPNFGTKGQTSSTNHPSSLHSAISWIDASGDFILQFGRFNRNYSYYSYNSQWKWDGTNWTWIGGENNNDKKGVYGLKGGAGLRNPGARKAVATCSSTSEILWLYGGKGYDKGGDEGHLSDLWKRDPNTGLWTWINGSDLKDIAAVYGTKGTAASANTPGKREDALLWSNGNNLWLFGGKYEDSGSDYYLNDLWKWDGSQWIWVSGSSSTNTSGVYSGTTMPGARTGSSKWIDDSGNLWLYGGRGYDKNGDLGRLSDLWKWDGTNWTFVSGNDLKSAACVYGTKGLAASTNKPGSRSGASFWKDANGHFWFFGGDGHDANGSYGSFNDVWKWDGTNWTWMYGNNTKNELGVYGTQHVAVASNVPGARKASTVWQDKHGSIWVFGGYGYGESGSQGRLNDLWMHNGTHWIWIKGDKTKDENADYNTIGTTDYSSKIGARSSHLSFTVNNTAYIFGGASRDESGNTGSFNDTWKIDTDYSIENGKINAISFQEINLSATETSGNALQNAGDKITLDEVNGTWAEVETDLPGNSNLLKRFNKTWTLSKNDASSNGGNFDLAFDLGGAPNADYSYYLMRRTGTSGDFSIENNLNYKLEGNQVIFTLSLSELNSGDQYTLGRSDTGAGYALNFDKTASSDYVTIGVDLNPRNNDFTVECWFKTDAIGAKQVLVAQNDGTGIGRPSIRIEASGKIASRLGGVTTAGTTTLVANKWYHVALVSDSFNLSLYLNGELEFGPTAITAQSANGNWLLGMNDNGNDAFDGDLDELRIWNDERTLDEILKNMFAPLRGDETDLLAYYKFDQSSGNYLPDVSSGTEQGVLSNFANTGTNSNWVPSTSPIVDKAGAKKLVGPGNALEFDGSNDKVETTLNVRPNAMATTTWEAWIYPTRLHHSDLQAIFSNDDGGFDRFLMIDSNDFIVSTGNGVFRPGYVIEANKWMHVAIVYKSDNIIFYANGIRYEHGSAEAYTYSDEKFAIGSSPKYNYNFKGKIDDVRVWNDERSQTEIQDNMYASLEGDEDGLKAYYDFDHASGTTLQDQSGNSKTGTLNNFSGTHWVSATDREPFKTVKAGSHSSNNTWKGGTAPSSSTDKLAVFHDLTLGSTGTYSRLQVNSGQTITTNADITVSGEVIINGTANGTNKIIMNGSAKQCIGGSGTMGGLQVNNSNDISLEGDITINGALTLTSGDIELNDHDLTITGTTSHGSSTSYLKLNGAGKVKTIVGASDVIIPVGRNPYLPVVLSGGDGAEFTIGVADKVYWNPTTNSSQTTWQVVTETWTIQASQAATNVTVQLGWDAAEESNFTRSASGIGYWENGVSSSWNRPTHTTAATGSDPYFQTRTIDFTTKKFYLGVGGSGSALPVELTHFTAQWAASAPPSNQSASLNSTTTAAERSRSRSAQLTWQTAMEENNSHFEIERKFGSLSGPAGRSGGVEGSWQTIGRVEGTGNSMRPINYTYTDKSPSLEREGFRMGQTIYYRLKQIDYNGNFEYSEIRTLNSGLETGNSISIYPNPANSKVRIASNAIVEEVQVFDTQGKRVLVQKQTNSLDVSALPVGIYSLRIQINGEIIIEKLRVN